MRPWRSSGLGKYCKEEERAVKNHTKVLRMDCLIDCSFGGERRSRPCAVDVLYGVADVCRLPRETLHRCPRMVYDVTQFYELLHV